MIPDNRTVMDGQTLEPTPTVYLEDTSLLHTTDKDTLKQEPEEIEEIQLDPPPREHDLESEETPELVIDQTVDYTTPSKEPQPLQFHTQTPTPPKYLALSRKSDTGHQTTMYYAFAHPPKNTGISNQNSEGQYKDVGSTYLFINENKNCKRSLHTGVHLKITTGVLQLHLAMRAPSDIFEGQVRCVLVRNNPAYTDFPVDTICYKHKGNVTTPGMEHHVLQASEAINGQCWHEEGRRKSVIFAMTNKYGILDAQMNLKIMCCDTCKTSTATGFKATVTSRDLWLVMTVEKFGTTQKIARRLLTIWPKTKIDQDDLNRQTRHQLLGASSLLPSPASLTPTELKKRLNTTTASSTCSMVREVDLMLKLVTKKARQCGMEPEYIKRRIDDINLLMEQTDRPAREAKDKEAEDVKQLLSWKYAHLQNAEGVSVRRPATQLESVADVNGVEIITI